MKQKKTKKQWSLFFTGSIAIILKNIENGMQISLYDAEKNRYDYSVTESFVVEPNETWVLDDAGDDRITIITCTDDGSQRLVVTGALKRK